MTTHTTTHSVGGPDTTGGDELPPPSDRIRSVARAVRILEVVGRTPTGLTVKGIGRRTGLSVATTYHLVRTLTYDGCLLRWEPGFYTLGLTILDRADDLSTQLFHLTHDVPPATLAQLLSLPPDQVTDLLTKAEALDRPAGRRAGRSRSDEIAPRGVSALGGVPPVRGDDDA